MKFNKNKYISVLFYIVTCLENNSNFGKTLLSYLLYFSDFNFYEIYGKSITNETYLKSQNGLIISTHFNNVIKELVRYNLLFTRKEPYFEKLINRYFITKFIKIELSYFEKMIIDDVISKFSHLSAKNISFYASRDSPYILADCNQNLEYFNVNYRDDEYSIKDLMWDFYDY